MLVKVEDNPNLIPTANYPKYAVFNFENFNPVQSRIFDFFHEDCNAVVASATSSGKTVVSEMFAAHRIRTQNKKVIYMAPMKALATEKYNDWTSEKHHFSDLKISICTGDYRLTESRKKEINEANIIILTSEVLNSRCRNYKSEKNEWLKDVGLLIVDESHLLTVPGRGDHLEVGLVNLVKLNPQVNILLLSATMPNVNQIGNWLSERLTNKKTYFLESNYRPCPLGIHYETYESFGRYDDQEDSKINKTIELLEQFPYDKFILFVHTKRTGELLKKKMKMFGFEAEFHSADLSKEKREELENKFKSKDKSSIQYLIATSTLAWGCNLPSRRVIIVGVHRGLQEVETYDIWQEVGRAGRPLYDPRGDAYILVPNTHEQKQINRLKKHSPIESRLLDQASGHYKTLAFHLTSEIHHKRIKTKDDVHNWYQHTLASFQKKDLNNQIVDDTINLLIKFGVIKEENGEYLVSIVGLISSMFYYNPFDIADLRRNFFNLFNHGLEYNNYYVSLALGNVDSLKNGIVNKSERSDMDYFLKKVQSEFGKETYTESTIKHAYVYNCLLNGGDTASLTPIARNFQNDFPRLIEVLSALDSMGTKWNKINYFKELSSRIAYGVPSHLVPLVKIPDIGKARAEKLWNSGYKDLSKIANDPLGVKLILNLNEDKIKSICENAGRLALEELVQV